MICVVSKGDKPLTIIWSLKGDIVLSDPTLTTTILGTQASMLVISSVDHQHSGVYTCRAENATGISKHSAELRVNGNLNWRHWSILLSIASNAFVPCILLFLEPPTIIPFSFGEHPVNVNQGDSAQLMCVVTRGDRPLSITWSLKGDIISSDPVLTTTMIGQQTSLLIIAAVDYQHSGTYTCRVENPAEIRTHPAELSVDGN